MYLESRKVQLMETVASMKQQQILKEIAKQLHNMSERLDQFIKIQGKKAAKLDFHKFNWEDPEGLDLLHTQGQRGLVMIGGLVMVSSKQVPQLLKLHK
jgi:hypothetical protein